MRRFAQGSAFWGSERCAPKFLGLNPPKTEILGRELTLTSGFDFKSHGHLRMDVEHLPMKLGAYIFTQSGVIDIFP